MSKDNINTAVCAKREYVSQKQAMSLKMFGFSKPCKSYYHGEKLFLYNGQSYLSNGYDFAKYPDFASAPTLHEVQDWLWVAYDIFLTVDLNVADMYFAKAYDLKKGTELIHDGDMFDTPYEAVAHGIDCVLSALRSHPS